MRKFKNEHKYCSEIRFCFTYKPHWAGTKQATLFGWSFVNNVISVIGKHKGEYREGLQRLFRG